ncbi:hypothetical protein PCANC_04068 [Puccinia coronata f. sp. avenae]|uniref:Uncharacterized protein n=1 Tax=Puccinia coronata f. sp. avenae TaxID=200324 RepID=A0A2N5W265_9BASI|nr:hypothetical protein PCANC_04068 [Puccinia coronata f. sp. avenae]
MTPSSRQFFVLSLCLKSQSCKINTVELKSSGTLTHFAHSICLVSRFASGSRVVSPVLCPNAKPLENPGLLLALVSLVQCCVLTSSGWKTQIFCVH